MGKILCTPGETNRRTGGAQYCLRMVMVCFTSTAHHGFTEHFFCSEEVEHGVKGDGSIVSVWRVRQGGLLYFPWPLLRSSNES